MKVPSVQPTSSVADFSGCQETATLSEENWLFFYTSLSFIFNFPVEIKPLFPKRLSQVGLIFDDHHENSQM